MLGQDVRHAKGDILVQECGVEHCLLHARILQASVSRHLYFVQLFFLLRIQCTTTQQSQKCRAESHSR